MKTLFPIAPLRLFRRHSTDEVDEDPQRELRERLKTSGCCKYIRAGAHPIDFDALPPKEIERLLTYMRGALRGKLRSVAKIPDLELGDRYTEWRKGSGTV